ncbi:apolipoprotein L3-like isoform X2 [Nannospalax galili]|uniref:apolipoprotein L3-like isoform X2 n=1 Tax=Nannospalax galili TaxID=1026970 RepID=UPI00111BDBFC|nr:apolipoprotein L3-like isoform X2 [Nannospalax galili]
MGDDEDALQTILMELIELTAMEDKDRLQMNLQDKMLLVALTRLKRGFEANIRKLHALADHIDKVHRACTISKVVTNSAASASGVLNILGLFLAPVTAGSSLVLSTTGIGLQVVATVAGAATAVVEERNRWSDEAEARSLVSATMNITKEVVAMGKIIVKLSKGSLNVMRKLSALGKHIQAIRIARAKPHLVADAKIFSTNGRISVRHPSQLCNAFEGTALAMTKEARIRSIAISGIFLAFDVYCLVKDLRHLQKGAKSESAEALRSLAWELEERLKEQILTLKTDSRVDSPSPRNVEVSRDDVDRLEVVEKFCYK